MSNDSEATFDYFCFSNLGSGSHVLVTLTVNSSDGESVTVQRQINISNCLNGVDDRSSNGQKGNSNYKPNDLILYPNPVINDLFVDIPTENVSSGVEILDVSGKVKLKKILQNKNTFNLDVSHFSDGIYFIRVKTAERIISSKFIKLTN